VTVSTQWPPPEAPEWLAEQLKNMPAPSRDMDPREEEAKALREAHGEVVTALECSVPAHYQWARFSAGELAQRVARKDAVAEAQQAFRQPRVALCGEWASGKTSLAVAMLRAHVLAARGKGALFVRCYRVAQARIQHAAGHGEAPLVEEAVRAPLVLLDDLGGERDTAVSPVADIIFERHAEDRPTWVTTGFTKQQLVGRYGAGVVRRLFERCVIIRTSDPKPRPEEAPAK
jgi:DNA replication protein DnaC